MNCRDVAAGITAYLDGELDATTSSALRGHLRTCAACRTLADDHARIAGALAALPPAEPPAALWQGVQARLAAAEAADARRSGLGLRLRGAVTAWGSRLRANVLPVTAVAAAAVVGAVWLARHRASTPLEPSLAITMPAPVEIRDAPAPPSPGEDIETALDREQARVDHLYAQTVAELLEDAVDERATWPAPRQRSFDAELARLQGDVVARPANPAVPAGADAFDSAEALAAAREARERAWQRLVRFLQHAALGDMVAEVAR